MFRLVASEKSIRSRGLSLGALLGGELHVHLPARNRVIPELEANPDFPNKPIVFLSFLHGIELRGDQPPVGT